VDYTKLEPWTDGRPARVPPSVGAVIEAVIQRFAYSPTSDGLDGLDDLDDDDDDGLDFGDEDSNGVGEMNLKLEPMS
jgi:hypothetical protein